MRASQPQIPKEKWEGHLPDSPEAGESLFRNEGIRIECGSAQSRGDLFVDRRHLSQDPDGERSLLSVLGGILHHRDELGDCLRARLS